ncbi:CpsD/CapB family tyrosine-protein kinase [Chengkuizengella axinellae]|uniref:non-specific protein-tyrosine kinase n=1 Tax=Chengkuizengella axinellae TaxID=3064388 RepID=A0ABT9IZA6_9BACL|nr:CpsD/CapB family tyrosine-protein kinase [Chengkuizengella sp. 2205SS18-9]MDP5274705.1 CpsD/CapB family tyrosine-protein kinase [Chengkuizengella sp. 2205SS18-9]
MNRENKREKNRLRSMVTFFKPKIIVSEQYRSIRTNIQFNFNEQSKKSIVVTSSIPNEGKSTTVANLAISFSQQGKSVLIVDADLRKPVLHNIFKISELNGLTNYLAGFYSSIEDIIYGTGVDNLSIVPCGPIPSNPAELLGSQNMKNFMEEALQKFDIVLIDTSPVLAVTDAQIVSNLCGGALLVVRSGKTDKSQVKKAKELLEQTGATIIGAVLNKKKASKRQNYSYLN